MVLAYHVSFAAYGFWLPNDPRGSRSDYVRAKNIYQHGNATRVDTRRSVAGDSHDFVKRSKAKKSLKYPEVKFDGLQARAVARGFSIATRKSGYTIYACAIMPQHVHLVVARHATHSIEQVIAHLKGEATKRLIAEDIHPLKEHREPPRPTPSPWSQRRGWTIFLNDAESIQREIRYVEENPLKDGLMKQSWSFVQPFEGL